MDRSTGSYYCDECKQKIREKFNTMFDEANKEFADIHNSYNFDARMELFDLFAEYADDRWHLERNTGRGKKEK